MTKAEKTFIQKIGSLKKSFDKQWKGLSSTAKRQIEKQWDVEHAYYSATLEGNGLDKNRFKELAAKIK